MMLIVRYHLRGNVRARLRISFQLSPYVNLMLLGIPDNALKSFAMKLRTLLSSQNHGADTLTTSIVFSLASKARHLWSIKSDLRSFIVDEHVVIKVKRRANGD